MENISLPRADSNEVFCPMAEPDRNLEFHGRMDAADRGRRMQWQCRARSPPRRPLSCSCRKRRCHQSRRREGKEEREDADRNSCRGGHRRKARHARSLPKLISRLSLSPPPSTQTSRLSRRQMSSSPLTADTEPTSHSIRARL